LAKKLNEIEESEEKKNMLSESKSLNEQFEEMYEYLNLLERVFPEILQKIDKGEYFLTVIGRSSIEFESHILLENELNYGTKRNLEVDKRLIVPVNMPLRFIITSGDVLHA
jgi:heme/copper-type cytochrome/quinol oxidase subunit 2